MNSAGTRERRKEMLHRIRVGGRDYEFLFFEDRCFTSDGREIFFIRTLSGVERVEVQPDQKILYLGANEYWQQEPSC